MRSALEDKLSALLLEGTPVDSITFSGDGEPTLNPEFPRIIDDTLMLRDAYFLRKVDNPIMKIDAPTDARVALINRPAPGYSLARVIEGLKRFEGAFVLQTMFLRSPEIDCTEPAAVAAWMDLVRELKPREIMAYTIDRPTPQAGLQKVGADEMRTLLKPLIDEGFNVQIRG